MSTLWFEPVRRGRHHVTLRYGVDDMRFTTTYWYDDVDFDGLEQRYGAAMLRAVEFHLLAFEANKAASLAPTAIDPGPYADLVTEAFWELWSTIFHHVWGVWRLENDLPEYRLPKPALPPRLGSRRSAASAGFGTAGAPAPSPAAFSIGEGTDRLLVLCGGGKDSLVSMRLLERAGIPYDTFVYSHSVYGSASFQHALIDDLVERCAPQHRHRGWVVDDAMDAPLSAVYPELGIERVVAAETVSSYWTALPVALQHGCTAVALGVTRSTDEHNLVWELTGERINYLWGMSSAAEQLLHDYVRTNLFSNLRMFHLLRPVYDLNVFSALQRELDAVPATHSCARQKPWCGRCAKCIYVWMHYVAWLPAETVSQCFTANLFDVPENRSMLRKMLGLEGYKPTDCVGTVSEARLAFAMCRAKGVGGVIADDIDAGGFVEEAPATLARYAAVEPPGPTFPPRLARELNDLLAGQAAITESYARDVLVLAPVP
jgi:UDP-N-acetyl-alpha-D-muramoyl-L-alanyl-L-glutamate epimerase